MSNTEKRFADAVNDIPGSLLTIKNTILSGAPLLDWMWATIAHIRTNGSPLEREELEGMMMILRQSQKSQSVEGLDPNNFNNAEMLYARYREKYKTLIGDSNSTKGQISRASAWGINMRPKVSEKQKEFRSSLQTQVASQLSELEDLEIVESADQFMAPKPTVRTSPKEVSSEKNLPRSEDPMSRKRKLQKVSLPPVASFVPVTLSEEFSLVESQPTSSRKKVKLFGEEEDIDESIDQFDSPFDWSTRAIPEDIEDIEEFDSPITVSSSKRHPKEEFEEDIDEYADHYDSEEEIELDEESTQISKIRNQAISELRTWANRDLLREPVLAKKVKQFIQENFKGMDMTFEMMTNDQLCRLYDQAEFRLSKLSNLQKLCKMTKTSSITNFDEVMAATLKGARLSKGRSVIKATEDSVDNEKIPESLLGIRDITEMYRMLSNISDADKARFKKDLEFSSPIPVVTLQGHGVTSPDERNRAVVYWAEQEDAPYVEFKLT